MVRYLEKKVLEKGIFQKPLILLLNLYHGLLTVMTTTTTTTTTKLKIYLLEFGHSLVIWTI